MSRKVSHKTKVQNKYKSKKDIVVPVSDSAYRNLRRQWFFDLKRSSLVILKAECDLQNKCKDEAGILIGIGSLHCELFFIPIHNKCVHEMGWVKESSLFCSHSCLTNEIPNDDDGNDADVDISIIKDSLLKFAFKYNEKNYDYFQSPNSTIFQLKPPLNHTIFSKSHKLFMVEEYF